jgi:hypothetical protein
VTHGEQSKELFGSLERPTVLTIFDQFADTAGRTDGRKSQQGGHVKVQEEGALPRKVERDDGQVAAKHVDDLHWQVDPARTRVQADAEIGRAYTSSDQALESVAPMEPATSTVGLAEL